MVKSFISMQVLDAIRQTTRDTIRGVAIVCNNLSRGKLTPNMVTTVGVAMHIPIGLLIAYGHLLLAGVLLIVFGLFDVLDGELARLQRRATPHGMLYDASTDRVKEVLLYAGIAYYLTTTASAHWAYLAVVACGASLTVSYAKAKGEVAIALKGKITDHHTLNRHFNEGLIPYEVRIGIVVVGLLFHAIVAATALVAGLAVISIFTCMNAIRKEL
jgi:CDP-diacylglycerol--glycerol-3-phosphate 3-phosphatidyltransferase